jgi:hypothetical protein
MLPKYRMDHDTLFHFTHDFDYRPSFDQGMIIAYRAGTEAEVTEECAARAATLGFGMYPDVMEDDLFEGRDDHDEDDDA